MKITFIFAIALWITFGGTAAGSDEIPGYVVRAIANPSRSRVERDFDRVRQPAKTIAFAGVAPGMVVGEFIPFYGYFTRLLSDVVGVKGKIYGIENVNWSNTAFDQKLTSQRRNI